MKQAEAQDVLTRVHHLLRARYGELVSITSQGVSRGQRIEFKDNGTRVRCVIKISSGGRISFGRKEDGTWSGLCESDRVIVVAPTELDGNDHTVSMFDQKVLVKAFDANQAAQETADMGHMPNWLAAFHEEGRGPRGVGDGFGNKALWSEPLPSGITSLMATEGSTRAMEVRALSMAEAKQGLAKTFGVLPEAVEITIRG